MKTIESGFWKYYPDYCCTNRSNNASSFKSLRFEETEHFVSFTTDGIVLQWPLVQLYLLHPTSYQNSNNLRNPLLLYEGANLNYKGKLSSYDPTGMFSGNERKRDNVSGERSSMQISSNSV